MKKQSFFQQIITGATSKPLTGLIAEFVAFVRELFVQSGMMLGIFTVMMIDIILGGISMYLMFEEVPYIPAAVLAGIFSVALSTVGFTLWRMIQEGTKHSWWMIALVTVLAFLDLWVDMAFMELLHGSGDVWRFMQPSALREYPRTPLWWGFLALISIVTLVNEPLTAILTEFMKNSNATKKYPTRKPTQSNMSSRRKYSGSKTQNQARTNYNPRHGSADFSYQPLSQSELQEFGLTPFNSSRE